MICTVYLQDCKISSCFVITCHLSFIACTGKLVINSKCYRFSSQILLFVTNRVMPLYIFVSFFTACKKMCFQKWILLSLVLFFNFISHLKQKYWNFVLLPNHRQSFLTLVFSEYEEGIRADSPRIVLNLNIYAYIIYKNVSSKLFCTSSNVLKEI